MANKPVLVSGDPEIPGLVFRAWQGESDFPGMAAVLCSSARADGQQRNVTAGQLAGAYAHLSNCDPARDLLIAEMDGQVIAYVRGWWLDEDPDSRIYALSAFLAPEWRRKRIGTALLAWMEARQRQLALEQGFAGQAYFQAEATQAQPGTAALLEGAGYRPNRYFFEMVRPSLDDIPAAALPQGVEVRPVLPEHYPALWASVDSTSRDEWGYTPLTDEDYREWLESPHFQPHLWQVAWDVGSNQVAGAVLTYIDTEENQAMNRKRGYTEGIGVERPWRRHGLARALIALSLQAQKAGGMQESAMAVDGDNPSNATRLYEACGFQVVSRNTIYRKLFSPARF